MDFVSHRGITLILFGRFAIKHISLFDVYLFVTFHSMFFKKSPLIKKCFSDLNVYEVVKSPGLVVQLKLKCLLIKLTHGDLSKQRKFKFNCLLEDIKPPGGGGLNSTLLVPNLRPRFCCCRSTRNV